MATDHRGNPINENNLAKTNKDRIFEGSNFGPAPDGEPTDAQYMDAEMYFAEKDEYPDEPDDDGLGPEGDTRSDELSARHQKEDVPLISDREDHSALLPSQQTGNRYEY